MSFLPSRVVTLLFFIVTTSLHAQVPQLINYQGRVGVNGVNFDGTGQFKFALVDAIGTTTYWSNDGTSTAGSEPAAAVSVAVSKGLYSVLLGDAALTGMTAMPATVFTHADVHLRIWFNDGSHGSQLLAPDKRIAAVGYAMMADSVADAAITTAKIADGAVTSAKLAPGVVQTSNLAAGAVGNAQLANSGLTITAGSGLGGGGAVVLGGTVALSNAGVLDLTGGGGITVDANTGSIILGSTATSANTAGAIVARDPSGNFSAGTITASLNGSATNFTAPLSGDVTGTQTATTIADSTVTGKAITGFASAAGTLTATDSLLTAINKLHGNDALKAPIASPTFTGTVTLPAGTADIAPLQLQGGPALTEPVFGAMEFDGTNLFLTNNSASPTRKTIAFTDSTIGSAQIPSGSITSAKLASGLTLNGTTSGTFSGPLTGNVTGNVSGSAASFTGSLTGDVTGTQSATAVSTVGGVTAANVASGANLANTSTSANTSGTLVKRDASGNFSAGTISGALNGNASTATNFTGALVGDVTGTQGATAIAASTVTGKAITGFESSAGSVTAADTLLTAINKLDGNIALKAPLASPTFSGTVSGSFSGPLTGNVTGNASTATTAGSATNFMGALVGDITGTQSATVVASVGGLNAADVASGATLANAATSANTASTTVKRDASGDFSAGTITANLNGNASTATTASTVTGTFVGDVTGTQGAMSISAGTVTGKSLTGFVSTTGTITASDSILSAINKLDGSTTAMSATLNSLVATPTETDVYYRVFSVGSLVDSLRSRIYAPFILPASGRNTDSIYQPIPTTVRHISELVAKATTTVSGVTVTVRIIRRDINSADTTLATVQKSGAASTSTVTVNTDITLDHTTNLYFLEAALAADGSGNMTTLHWVRLREGK